MRLFQARYSAWNYDGQVFSLDGRMDLEVSFEGREVITPVYIKMDASDQLLLSEIVCRQLGIVTYHPKVEVWHGGHQSNNSMSHPAAAVPVVRIKLVQVVRCLPQQTALAKVKIENGMGNKPMLLEASEDFRVKTGLEIDSTFVTPDENGYTFVTITNKGGYTVQLDEGIAVGSTSEAVHIQDVGVEKSSK